MTTYPSRRDLTFLALGWGTVLLAVAGAAPAFTLATRRELVVLLAIVAAVDAVVLWVLYGTRYWFDESSLQIRFGPIRVNVPLAQIESVEPSSDTFSSPALSLDRLQIRYGGRRILISPRDRDGFLADLQERCPGLRRIDC